MIDHFLVDLFAESQFLLVNQLREKLSTRFIALLETAAVNFESQARQGARQRRVLMYTSCRATQDRAGYQSLAERGISSAGRAPALQAGGRRFDPVILHQKK